MLWERPSSSRASYHPARAYSFVVEIVSPNSRDEDQFEKPRLYASSGIPAYWLVEPHPEDEWDAMVKMYRLEPTGYALARTVAWSEFEAKPH